MGQTVEFHPEARRDFDESFDWYSERSAAVAVRFALAIDEAVQRIGAVPKEFCRTEHGCRYCVVKRFPFRLIFVEELDRVYVIAVAHDRREPSYWRDRVR